jgi:hypothetical protein
LDYYNKVFNGNPDKIKQVREAILKDFQANEHDLSLAVEAQRITDIRKVLHKMTPIAESLQYSSLSETILAFKDANFEPAAMKELVKKMKEQLLALYTFLKESE